MPFDGNGIYNPLSPPQFPAVPGTLIRASQYNEQILDMAAALTNCITADGQTQPTGNIPMNNHRITGLATATDPNDAVTLGQLRMSPKLGMLRGYASFNSSTINTMSWSAGLLTDAVGQNAVYIGSASLACDISVAGPVANGRDQAAAFPNTTWIYFFVIAQANGTAATIASLSSTAPTLPSGYTVFQLAGAIRKDSIGNLLLVQQAGSMVAYDMNASDTRIVASANSATFASASAAAYVPPITKRCDLTWTVAASNAGAGTNLLLYRPTGSSRTTGFIAVALAGAAGAAWSGGNTVATILGVSNSIDHRLQAAFTGAGYFCDVVCYYVPNGDY